jgi:hypothetical protein
MVTSDLIVRAKEIAGVDGEGAGAPGDGGSDRGVLQVELRLIDLRAVGCDCRLERRGGRDLRIQVRSRNQPASEQFFAPRALRFRIGELCGIARENGFRLLQRRVERSGIEREERLTLTNLGAFREVHRAQLSGHLRANLNSDDRLNRAEGGDRHRHVFMTTRRRDGTVRNA